MLIAFKNDIDTARMNRTLLEMVGDGVAVNLPEGEVFVDKAPRFRSGAVINGHRNRTTITNAYSNAPYFDNCCGYILGDGPEYINTFTRVDKRTVVCPAATLYEPGNSAYFWVWDGYIRPGFDSTCCTRREIVSVAPDGTTVFDDDIPDIAFDYVKLLHGFRTDPFRAGQGYVTTKHWERFKAGDQVYLTGGPMLANEVYGTFTDVVAAEDGKVYLKNPVRINLDEPSLVLTDPIRDTTFTNVIFGKPLNTASHSFIAKFARGLRFYDCGAAWGALALCASQDCVIDGVTGEQQHNTLTSSVIQNGISAVVGFEEGCFDVTVQDLSVYTPRGGQHGIYSNPAAPSSHITVRNVEIFNTGFNWGAGQGSPIFGTFDDGAIENVRVYNTQPGTAVYSGGKNLRVTNLTADCVTVFAGATNQTLVNVSAPQVNCGWVEEAVPSTGRAILTDNVVVHRPGNWELVNSRTTADQSSVSFQRKMPLRHRMGRP